MFESIAINKDYLNKNFKGKFEIEVPVRKWKPILLMIIEKVVLNVNKN